MIHPFYEATATAPELADWWDRSFTPTIFAAGRVPTRTKALLALRLAALNGVEYPGLVDDAAAAGVMPEEVAAIGGPLAALPLSAAELAVLELAAEMHLTNMAGYMDERLYARLAEHYDDGATFELGMTMAILCGFAKFLKVYGLTGSDAGGAHSIPA